MKRTNRKLSLLLAGSVLATVVAGCSNGPSTVQEGTPPAPDAHPDTRNLGGNGTQSNGTRP